MNIVFLTRSGSLTINSICARLVLSSFILPLTASAVAMVTKLQSHQFTRGLFSSFFFYLSRPHHTDLFSLPVGSVREKSRIKYILIRALRVYLCACVELVFKDWIERFHAKADGSGDLVTQFIRGKKHL